jgi:rare lipoprotein A (peptidoglycan hydrolase)
MQNKFNVLLIIIALLLVVLNINLYRNKEEIEYLNPLVEDNFVINDDCIYVNHGIWNCTDGSEVNQEELKELMKEIKKDPIIKEENNKPRIQKLNNYTGVVSYYSHDGCIGCHPEQIMANGEKFDENAMTLAFNRLPLNTEVKVCNLDNNKCVNARVTDTGGFENLGRIADLSLGLAKELEAKTDKSIITITAL